MIFVGLDSNVLAYLAGVDRSADDTAKVQEARRLLGQIGTRGRLIAAVQALGELYVVLTRAGASRGDARDIVLRFHRSFAAADSNSGTMLAALDLVVAHKLQYWDATILNACADAGCVMLLSEDMQDGFVWRGMTVTNPFSSVGRDRLETALCR
jgi:predicted nucleic acid-binding protein